MDFDDFEEVLESVTTNSTQSTDVLKAVVANPDLQHVKAAAVVVFLLLCRELGHYIIPLVLKHLKSLALRSELTPTSKSE